MTVPAPVALVADDSPTIRGFHAAVLRAAGFAVHEAENGAAALAVLAGQPVDLAVVDVNMPVMDGLTFLERMTDVGARPGAVLVVSSEGADADVVEAVRRGADWYVVKPVDADTLTDLARRLTAADAAPLAFAVPAAPAAGAS